MLNLKTGQNTNPIGLPDYVKTVLAFTDGVKNIQSINLQGGLRYLRANINVVPGYAVSGGVLYPYTNQTFIQFGSADGASSNSLSNLADSNNSSNWMIFNQMTDIIDCGDYAINSIGLFNQSQTYAPGPPTLSVPPLIYVSIQGWSR
jgi:hypothetical protein